MSVIAAIERLLGRPLSGTLDHLVMIIEGGKSKIKLADLG